jgi:DNA polymerase III delta prime subunit
MDIYNRNRPRTFKDMYQTSTFVTHGDRLLQNTLEGNLPDLSHFMIFHSEYGGVGKTTAGRIIAAGLNPECSDRELEYIFNGIPNNLFIEINGGSYRKIDDARKLEREIEFMRNAILASRKVYMINEAHKLTSDAQEAFLQLTENVPETIYFIFTTTRMNFLNDKLLSRAQKYGFKSLEKPGLKKLLLDIERKERGNGIPDYIIDQIFEESGNSLRDAINSLGEYLSTGEVGLGVEDKGEGEIHYFSELIRNLELVAMGDKISWTKTIVPIIDGILNSVSVEEARIKLMYRLHGILTSPRGITTERGKDGSLLKKSELYRRLSIKLREPIGYPPKSYMVLGLYQCFMEARDIAQTKTVQGLQNKSR